MKSITFGEGNRSGNELHIELPGCTVNITIGLTDRIGRPVTSVRISPDDESRGGDGTGYCWRQADATRIIRDLLPGLHGKPSTTAGDCRFCQARIEQGDDHLWANVSDIWEGGEPDPNLDEADRLACPKAPRRDSGLRAGLHEPAPSETELVAKARGWIADCEWADLAEGDIADLNDAQVIAGINRHYEGGWAAFVAAETA